MRFWWESLSHSWVLLVSHNLWSIISWYWKLYFKIKRLWVEISNMECSFISIGTFGNLLTIIVMIKFRRLHNFCTPFLINLSICDAMMTALILPILGFNGITGYSYLPTILCKMVSIIFHVIIGKYVIRLYRNKGLMNYFPNDIKYWKI